MCACLLFDPFQLYVGMLVVFGLFIYTATAHSCTVGNENVFRLGGGWNVNKNVVLLSPCKK